MLPATFTWQDDGASITTTLWNISPFYRRVHVCECVRYNIWVPVEVACLILLAKAFPLENLGNSPTASIVNSSSCRHFHNRFIGNFIWISLEMNSEKLFKGLCSILSISQAVSICPAKRNFRNRGISERCSREQHRSCPKQINCACGGKFFLPWPASFLCCIDRTFLVSGLELENMHMAQSFRCRLHSFMLSLSASTLINFL